MSGERCKILIVDDSEMNREILSDMLEDEYEILQAEGGTIAIQIMNEQHEELSLVLLDMNMSDMSGIEVLRIMKDRLWLEKLPVICISADSTDKTIRLAYELGVADYFAHPFDMKVVKRRVHNTIALYDKSGGNLRDAIGMLSSFFYRILKINLTNDNYMVLKKGEEDTAEQLDRIQSFTGRLTYLAQRGYVHEEDLEEYLQYCDAEWLKEQFASGKERIGVHYRRSVHGEFKWFSMEIIRSSEYSDTNQVVLMYVRDLNDDYLKQLDVVMRRSNDSIGMVSINVTKGICMTSAVRKLSMNLLDNMESIEFYIRRLSQYLIHESQKEKLVAFFNKERLLQAFAQGQTTVSIDISMLDRDSGDVHVIRASLEMVHNSVTDDVEGILQFIDITGIFLSEKMTSMMYQKNFDQVMIIDAKKRLLACDTPDNLNTYNYHKERTDYDAYMKEVLANTIPQKEKEIFKRSTALDMICEQLKTQDCYSFTIHQEAGGEKRLKNYTYLYLNRKFGLLIGAVEDITELSGKDVVTSGYNRQGFMRQAKRVLKESGCPENYAILYFNIRNFKSINELFGIEVGDMILREIYKLIENSALHPVLTARVEADHFACLIEKKNLIYEEIDRLCEQKILENNKVISIYQRCGIYLIEEGDDNIAEMIDLAKAAKKYIHDEYVQPYKIYDDFMKSSYINKANLVDEMTKGLQLGEFKVYYQPVVDTQTEKIVSAEALIRWKHTKRGFISPGVFIPALEENGHISELDRYVAEHVSSFLIDRKLAGKRIVPVSMNLSWMDFYDQSMIDWIGGKLEKCKALDIKTRLEITETSYAAITNDRNQALNTLKEHGADLLMDDFGSGYSSFGMLQNYNFDILKIDMSFVRQIEQNEKTRNIVRYIIAMAHTLGMKLVAEGVENKVQADFLRDCGCDYIQGHYYFKPLPEEEFAAQLEAEQKEA